MALTEINAYLSLPQGIVTSGQPTVEQFAEIQTVGYEVIVNLAMPRSANWISNEAEVVTGLGMTYVALPVSKHPLNRIWTPNAVWQNFMDAVIELYGE